MAVKYKEKIKKDVTNWKMILILIVFIVAMNGTSYMLRQLEDQRLAGYISVVILLVMIVLSIKVINCFITEYEFIITQSRLKANKLIGKRSSKEVLDISLKQLEYIVSIERLKSESKDLKKKVTKKQNLTLIGMNREKIVGLYREGEKLNSFIFQPNDKMLEILRNEIDKEKYII